jgi:hypothetical protein
MRNTPDLLNKKWIPGIVHWSFIALLVGLAWRYLFWDVPLREWLWSAYYMKGIMTFVCQCTWEEYLSSPAWDKGIQMSIRIQGVLLTLSALVLLIPAAPVKWKRVACIVPLVIICILSFCLFKENFFRLGFLIELAALIAMPFVYIGMVLQKKTKEFILPLKIILALTFTGHGLYAVGFYPVPGIFVDMMIAGFGLEEPAALSLLKVFGFLDFIVAALLFIPQTARIGAGYMLFWGLLTTLGRFTQITFTGLFWDYLHQWGFETLVRNMHFTLPWVLLILLKKKWK